MIYKKVILRSSDRRGGVLGGRCAVIARLWRRNGCKWKAEGRVLDGTGCEGSDGQFVRGSEKRKMRGWLKDGQARVRHAGRRRLAGKSSDWSVLSGTSAKANVEDRSTWPAEDVPVMAGGFIEGGRSLDQSWISRRPVPREESVRISDGVCKPLL